MGMAQQFEKQVLSRLAAAGAVGRGRAPGVLLWVGRFVLRSGLPPERASPAGHRRTGHFSDVHMEVAIPTAMRIVATRHNLTSVVLHCYGGSVIRGAER